jgi:hypothetical protein
LLRYCFFCTGYNVQASEEQKPIRVVLNNEPIIFSHEPILKNEITFVPFREIFENLGYSITWNEREQRVTAQSGDLVISFKINSWTAVINNTLYLLEQGLFLSNDTAYVPLRIISEFSNGDVIWNEENREIVISIIKDKPPETIIKELVTRYSSSWGCYDFVMAATKSNSVKFNAVTNINITLHEQGNEASVNYVLDYELDPIVTSNGEISELKFVNVYIGITDKYYRDEAGNWLLSRQIKDRQYDIKKGEEQIYYMDVPFSYGDSGK